MPRQYELLLRIVCQLSNINFLILWVLHLSGSPCSSKIAESTLHLIDLRVILMFLSKLLLLAQKQHMDNYLSSQFTVISYFVGII